jgi:uncharacterized protein (TIGR02466 family)
MSTIHKLFPRTVYQEDNLLLENLPDYKRFCIKKLNDLGVSSNEMLNVPSTHKTFDRFYIFPELRQLVGTICSHTIKYATELGYEDLNDLTIKNMWVNYSKKGSYIFPHIHPDSFISGVFYIDCTTADNITFFDNPQHITGKRPDSYNEYNYEYMNITCNPGRLLLFGGNMLHGTHSQQSDEKIAVSFNLG